MKLNPWVSFMKANLSLIAGRFHFPRERLGEVLAQEDGGKFTIFRQMVKDPGRETDRVPGAVFKVRFQVAKMSPRRNKIFSWFTIPFFAGLPGFRSKLWLLDEENSFFMGIYEWASVEDAENYSQSFAMKFMTNRSVPGSASFEIIAK